MKFKRTMAALLAAAMMISFSACKAEPDDNEDTETVETGETGEGLFSAWLIEKQVTDADLLASQIKTQVTTFFAQMDASAKGIDMSASGGTVKIDVSDGVWTVVNPEDEVNYGSFRGEGATWSGGSDIKWDCCLYLADVLRDFKDGKVELLVQKGKCVGVSVAKGKDADWAGVTVEDFDSGRTSIFKDQDGVGADGVIIGTYPKIKAID